MSTESEKLLPCPFCGKQPRSAWHGASDAGDDGFWGIDCCQAFSHQDSEADAAARWNTRANNAERDRLDAERMDWLIDNATTKGGGNGFELKVFIPHDSECIRGAIDAARNKGKTNEPR